MIFRSIILQSDCSICGIESFLFIVNVSFTWLFQYFDVMILKNSIISKEKYFLTFLKVAFKIKKIYLQ